jgi:hypothetical protein
VRHGLSSQIGFWDNGRRLSPVPGSVFTVFEEIHFLFEAGYGCHAFVIEPSPQVRAKVIMNNKNIPSGWLGRREAMFNKTFLGAVGFSLVASTSAFAQTELQWWHAQTGANNEVINRLSEEFNASQKEYKVVPSYKGNYADTMNAGIAAFRAGNAPHIMQVFEVGTATMMGAKGAVKPVHQLMQEAGEKFDPKAYLPTITGYYSTSKGEMLSFPFNSSSMVMWVNKDELKKAGVSEIPKT